MEKIFGLGIVVALMLILSGCITPDNNEIANPASVYCVENGGTLEIITNEEGGQIGICTFANGKECEEWAFYNGECDSKWCPDEGKACTKEYVPVCGKDGKTYGNKCTAESACVEIAYEGECENTQIANPASVYCVENGGILEIREGEEGQYGVCVFGTFECEEWAFFRGECEKPCERWGEPCTLEYMPVCGVDGITYGNRCAAETSCVEVAYEGECEVEKVYCTEEQRGAEVCILLYAPVCGYNANEQMIETFSNSCFACANATVEYWVQGECPI